MEYDCVAACQSAKDDGLFILNLLTSFSDQQIVNLGLGLVNLKPYQKVETDGFLIASPERALMSACYLI